MQTEEKLERLVADIPVTLKRRIAAAAALRGKTIRDLIVEILEEWLARNENRDVFS